MGPGIAVKVAKRYICCGKRVKPAALPEGVTRDEEDEVFVRLRHERGVLRELEERFAVGGIYSAELDFYGSALCCPQ